MVRIGTSGYSYQDWIGIFYPEGIKKGDMLSFYARNFSFTEINSTYYQMPNPYAVYQWESKTPDDFLFSVKAHSSMTHTRDATREDYSKFIHALGPLKEKGKLACIVFQFPYSFHCSTVGMDYLKKIREFIPDENICIEFRNDQWISEANFQFLKEYQYGYVCVDEPKINGLVKNMAVATAPIGYIRFHGRNAQKWYKHQQAYERYDYLYSESELAEWLPGIINLEKRVNQLYVAFNNHFRAQGIINGRMLQNLLMNK